MAGMVLAWSFSNYVFFCIDLKSKMVAIAGHTGIIWK
jgi:hypothetical protein